MKEEKWKYGQFLKDRLDLGNCPIAETETEKSALEVEKEDNVAKEDEEENENQSENLEEENTGTQI